MANVKVTKGTEAWVGEYNGHSIKVVNSLKARLYIDDVEVDKQKGIFSTHVVLRGNIPDTDENVVVFVYSVNGVNLVCDMVVGKGVESAYGVIKKDGEFHAFSDEEKAAKEKQQKELDEASTIAAIVSTLP